MEPARPADGFLPQQLYVVEPNRPRPRGVGGDAVGALDPTQGLGTSLLLRDVRALSELLTTDRDWERATSGFARQRQAYYEVIRAYDRWCALLDSEEGPEADRRRKLNAAAREQDSTLGGSAVLEACGGRPGTG